MPTTLCCWRLRFRTTAGRLVRPIVVAESAHGALVQAALIFDIDYASVDEDGFVALHHTRATHLNTYHRVRSPRSMAR